jgi:hypothetical protein
MRYLLAIVVSLLVAMPVVAVPSRVSGKTTIPATYRGDANVDKGTAPAIPQSVKSQTQVGTSFQTPIYVGELPVITVFVNPMPSSPLVPSGTASIREGGTILGMLQLVRGGATFRFDSLDIGDHTLVVDYSGDNDFEASSATIVQSVIAPAVSIRGARVLEGNRGVTPVSLVVSLSAPVSVNVRVSFSTLDASATEGDDYEKASGVIEFQPGEITHAIEIHVIGDTFPEDDEMFLVALSNPVNATIEGPSAVIVIVNDDQVPPRHRAARH